MPQSLNQFTSNKYNEGSISTIASLKVVWFSFTAYIFVGYRNCTRQTIGTFFSAYGDATVASRFISRRTVEFRASAARDVVLRDSAAGSTREANALRKIDYLSRWCN